MKREGRYHRWLCPHGCGYSQTYEPAVSEYDTAEEYQAAWESWYYTTEASQEAHLTGTACFAAQAVIAALNKSVKPDHRIVSRWERDTAVLYDPTGASDGH